MLNTITTYIEQHHLLPANGEIIIAVSGGADSLCLLHLLQQLCGPSKRYPELQLHVAHLNHKLRGTASAQDAATVAQLATAWSLPFTLGEIDVPALALAEHLSLEDAARTARYRFLRQVAHGQPIAVAHHLDDQVETLLLHWLRGSGLTGMLGMLPRQQNIIRPLLEVSHAQTVAYCQQHQLIPLEDASNTDPRFLRNRIRHELLPLLESLNPGIRATLLRNATVMSIDAAWIEAQIDACWPTIISAEQDDSIDDTINIHLPSLLALPLSLQRHLLRRVTAQLSAGQSPLEPRHHLLIEDLLHKPNNGETLMLDLPQQLHITRTGETVTVRRGVSLPAPWGGGGVAVELPIPGRIDVPGTPWIAIAETLPDELLQAVQSALHREDWPQVWQLLPSTPYTVYIDADSVVRRGVSLPAPVPSSGLHPGGVSSPAPCPFLRVRTRQPADRMQPLGMAHEKKVQDILVDKHIARTDRMHIPFFLSASHSVWLAGVQLDDRVRLTSNTQRILRLSITKKEAK